MGFGTEIAESEASLGWSFSDAALTKHETADQGEDRLRQTERDCNNGKED
jgi:hypothetical protein